MVDYNTKWDSMITDCNEIKIRMTVTAINERPLNERWVSVNS